MNTRTFLDPSSESGSRLGRPSRMFPRDPYVTSGRYPRVRVPWFLLRTSPPTSLPRSISVPYPTPGSKGYWERETGEGWSKDTVLSRSTPFRHPEIFRRIFYEELNTLPVPPETTVLLQQWGVLSFRSHIRLSSRAVVLWSHLVPTYSKENEVIVQ